ncbi:MAG: capsular biosynthesis protein [Bacillaceae bacterium]|nr:capsular biosynthesis protein [Bacillaceae bacterium]
MAKKKGKRMQHQRRGLIAKQDPKSPITEQYRTIRTNIQFSAVDQEIRSIVVTSTAPGEGKSTTIANLAIVFAQQGKRVLLVDADLRKPTVHITFQFTNTIGLTNVLTKQVSVLEAVRKTDVENLYVMTSGPIPPNPAEILASQSMHDLLAEAEKHFDYVLFDAPPILAVTDAQILASLCDGTLFVVSSGKTERDYAVKAKELLLAANGKLLGAILNNKKEAKQSYYYYYGS